MLNSLGRSDHERLSRAAALAVGAAAALACLYLAVRIAWLLVPVHEAAAPPLPDAGTPTAGAGASVAKWHLFGNPQALAHSAASAPLQTVLKLGLRGTLALPDPKDRRAIAIIANEQGAESSYRIGDAVGDGAKLAEVYADHVVLDHQGVAETLQLPRPAQHAPPLPERNALRASGAAASSVRPGYLPRSAGAAAPPPPPAHGARGRFDAQQFAHQIHPVFGGNGRIVGVDFTGADATMLARVGLKPTDVVTAINGTPLASVSDPRALMEQLQNSSSIQVTVQRDGRPATLTLSLR